MSVFIQVPFDDLKAIVEFVYRGEVDVANDRLDSVVRTAAMLEVKVPFCPFHIALNLPTVISCLKFSQVKGLEAKDVPNRSRDSSLDLGVEEANGSSSSQRPPSSQAHSKRKSSPRFRFTAPCSESTSCAARRSSMPWSRRPSCDATTDAFT